MAQRRSAPRLATIRLPAPHEDVELGFVEWGPQQADQVVLCVHGLTRNARDFDELARSLAHHQARVIAVDVAGRGRSSWLDDPSQYNISTYAAHLVSFLSALQIAAVDWIGTSMGGLIGMIVAAQDGNPVRQLVLNDVGPLVPEKALRIIQQYLGLDLAFENLSQLEDHLRLIHAGFGRLTDEQWHHLATHSARRTPERWHLHYDPQIRAPYAEMAAEDLDLWKIWDRITCPTFVLHGKDSAVLTPETVYEMQRRGPKATVVDLPNVGHAPALMAADQVRIVKGWLSLVD